jgi:transposase
MCWRSITDRLLWLIRSSAWMRPVSNWSAKRAQLCRPSQGSHGARTTNTSGHSVANLFLFCEPLTGWCEVQVTERRTRIEWAEAMRELSDRHYPAAERITIMLDNLNTHGLASFYEALAPDEARRWAERFEFHYTPKHGSWLNMAEIELTVLSRQCRDRRLGGADILRRGIEAWQRKGHEGSKRIDWQFTAADARTKRKRLYPVIKT